MTRKRKRNIELYPVVAIDTREQLPYEFPAGWITWRHTLATGDYCIMGDWEGLVVERKSHNDLLGCIFTERFERELQRLEVFKRPVLLCETSISQIRNDRYYKGNAQAVIGKLESIILRGVQVVFAGDRDEAQRLLAGLIRKWVKHVNSPV